MNEENTKSLDFLNLIVESLVLSLFYFLGVLGKKIDQFVSFNLVLSQEMLEHLLEKLCPQRFRFFFKLVKRMKKSGKILVSLNSPHFDNLKTSKKFV